MCLSASRVLESNAMTGAGWKVFRIDPTSNDLLGELQAQHLPRPVGEWLDERAYRERQDLRDDEAGWHVFLSEEDASALAVRRNGPGLGKFCVRKVLFRIVLAIGSDSCGNGDLVPALTAQEIYILP